MINGYGVLTYNSENHKGDKYEGYYKNWNREGKGVYYYSNGDVFDGEYKNDKRNGKGIYYYKNGDREMGDYLDDNKKGIHVMLSYKGKISNKKY